MRKVILNMNENQKYSTIKNFVDHGGNKHRIALKLSLTIRQVNRLINIYKTKGKAGFIHGNKNQPSSNSLNQKLKDKIIQLYSSKYINYNFLHFLDKLIEVEKINVSYKTVYRILYSNNFYSPKEHKITRRKRAKQRVLATNTNISKSDIDIAINHEVDIENSHPRKARSKYFGEEIQMDASIHNWFSNHKSALHLAIDNATGTIVGGFFDMQETLFGYYNVYKSILLNYGIPAKFLTDNRTVFNYESSKRKDDSKDVLTQFGYACKTLGTYIETSSVSQYKGQIERANATFQDRLVNELHSEKIDNIIDANNYLINVFIPDFNKRFSLNYKKFISVMEVSPSLDKINLVLATISTRVFDNGSTISYKNIKYQAFDENNKLVCFKPKTKCLVIKSFDNRLFITVDDKVYFMSPFVLNKSTSENFDPISETKVTKKRYIPPMTHPWKREAFIKQQNRAHNFHQYT